MKITENDNAKHVFSIYTFIACFFYFCVFCGKYPKSPFLRYLRYLLCK